MNKKKEKPKKPELVIFQVLQVHILKYWIQKYVCVYPFLLSDSTNYTGFVNFPNIVIF